MPTPFLSTALRTLRPVLPLRLRLPSGFDPTAYLAQHPDVRQAGGDPALHFLRYGRFERRHHRPLAALQDEYAVWAGNKDALVRLERSAAGSDAEAAWARLALARMAARFRDWPRAAALLDQPEQFATHLGLPDAGLLAMEMALRLGDLQKADALDEQLSRQFGALPELAFLNAYRALQTGNRAGWGQALQRIFASERLVSPTLGQARGPDAFDSVQAQATPLRLPETAPLVSIILPVRNAGHMIDTALEGLLAQSWHRIEVLVVVNGCTDDTEARVQAHAAKDARVQLLQSPAARGAYGARNLGAAKSQGTYLTVQDADDWSHPERIAQQVARMTQGDTPAGCMVHWLRATPDLCPAQCSVHPCMASLMIHRAVLDRLGPWDEVRAAADSEFLERLRHVHGQASVALVRPRAPLAFGRTLARSLSHAPETGLLGEGAGARTAYIRAARAWHVAAGTPVMPASGQSPGPRPFPVPEALALPESDATE
ncbi:MAG: glycosyltransferase family 2 protein [Roseinatronobacter sp.]